MNNIKNDENNLIQSRYHFSGNIKVPNNIIHSLSESEKELVINVLSNLYSRIIDLCPNKANICIEYPLSINRTLYVDIKDNKLNFYIKDIKEKEFTQILSSNDIEKIIRAESNILTHVKNESNRNAEQKKAANLVSTLIHHAFNNKQHNKASPPIQGCKLNDDFELY